MKIKIKQRFIYERVMESVNSLWMIFFFTFDEKWKELCPVRRRWRWQPTDAICSAATSRPRSLTWRWLGSRRSVWNVTTACLGTTSSSINDKARQQQLANVTDTAEKDAGMLITYSWLRIFFIITETWCMNNLINFFFEISFWHLFGHWFLR